MTEKVVCSTFYTHIKVPVKPLNAVIQGLYLLVDFILQTAAPRHSVH